MSKLIYPANGLHARCKGMTNDCADRLTSAISNCAFDIPSSFPYKGYLNGLGGTLSQYRQEINNIDTKIQSTDKSFVSLSDNLTISAGKIITSKIVKRDRLIV